MFSICPALDRDPRRRKTGLRPAGALLTTIILTGAGTGAQAPAPAVAVQLSQRPVWSIQPAAIELRPGQTTRFSAPVAQEHAAAVTWRATGGDIAPDGTFTAPPTPGRYVVTGSLLGGAVAANAEVQVVAPQAAATEPADRFVDSVGVNIHLHYNGTLYRENFELTRQRLLELGIRHYRDILVDTTWQPYYERHNALGAAGLKGLFVMQHPRVPDAVLRDYPARVASSFAGYEAPNEHDNTGDPQWVAAVRNSLLRLRALESIPELARFPIVGPSTAFTNRQAELGDVSAFFDFGNLHNYFGGRNPGTSGWGATDPEYGSYAWHFGFTGQYFGGRPTVTTETGYLTGSGTADAVPDVVAARYLPRVLLEQFQRGIVRTYLYELADEPGKAMHGLMTADGTPKPAFRAVAGLLSLLADPGAAIAPQPLRYTLSGAGGDVRHLTFQKRDGSYYLAIWVERPGYDVLARRATPVSAEAVAIAADGVTLVAVHQWNADGTVTAAAPAAGALASFPVTDTLQVLEFRP